MEEDGDFNEIFNALPTDHDAAADVRAKLVEWEKISSTDRTDTLEGKRASGVEIAFNGKIERIKDGFEVAERAQVSHWPCCPRWDADRPEARMATRYSVRRPSPSIQVRCSTTKAVVAMGLADIFCA
jgi:hypothetical protein